MTIGTQNGSSHIQSVIWQTDQASPAPGRRRLSSALAISMSSMRTVIYTHARIKTHTGSKKNAHETLLLDSSESDLTQKIPTLADTQTLRFSLRSSQKELRRRWNFRCIHVCPWSGCAAMQKNGNDSGLSTQCHNIPAVRKDNGKTSPSGFDIKDANIGVIGIWWLTLPSSTSSAATTSRK